MKTGLTIQELATEVAAQQSAKRDIIADTREIVMLNGKEVHIPGQGEFPVKERAHDQIGTGLGIPAKFYDRLRGSHPTLLDHNVNTLWRTEPETRLFRLLGGELRSVQADRYRIRDNIDLIENLLPTLGEFDGMQCISSGLSDDYMHITALFPKLEAEIKVGDTVQWGVRISNSEVGLGSTKVVGFLYRLICENGMTSETVLKSNHVGRRITGDADAIYEFYRDETIAADDRAYWLKAQDAVRNALTETAFHRAVDKLRDATQTEEIERPSAGIREITKRYSITDTEGESILRHLARGGDLTKYGAIQAITRTAQDIKSYDRSMEFEAIGGKLLDTSRTEWLAIAGARA